MARSLQDQLDDLDAAIAVREAGDAFDEHAELSMRWRGAPLEVLYRERERLMRLTGQIQQSGAKFLRHGGMS